MDDFSSRAQAQNWTREAQRLYDQLRGETTESKALCCHLAEKAAEGEVPVAAAFWREKLRSLLINAKELKVVLEQKRDALREKLPNCYYPKELKRVSILN